MLKKKCKFKNKWSTKEICHTRRVNFSITEDEKKKKKSPICSYLNVKSGIFTVTQMIVVINDHIYTINNQYIFHIIYFQK